MRLDEAAARTISLAQSLLGALPSDVTVDATGAYRRRLETTSSIDLACDAPPATISEALNSLGMQHERLGSILVGHTDEDSRPFRIFSSHPLTYGAVLLVSTGGAYLDRLQEEADRRGVTLTNDGLLDHNNQVIPTITEREAFESLGVAYVEPEQRDDKYARPNKNLISTDDIRGVIHNHTRWSDGTDSILELAIACMDLGYAYLGIADHSRRSFYASGLSIDKLLQQGDAVSAAAKTLKEAGHNFEILHGAEVDILPDGSLDYPDDILEALDYVVISVHQEFNLPLGKQTDRVVAAIHHPMSDILGHPTGRLLLKRPGYDIDLDAVIDACIETGTTLEINAKPHRLDLDWRWVKVASERGAIFSINPDAHAKHELNCIPFGVSAARKASLSRDQIVNTEETPGDFLSRLKRNQGTA
jgi:DNA polymerase (family 10)